jgi:hypothetical protein
MGLGAFLVVPAGFNQQLAAADAVAGGFTPAERTHPR